MLCIDGAKAAVKGPCVDVLRGRNCGFSAISCLRHHRTRAIHSLQTWKCSIPTNTLLHQKNHSRQQDSTRLSWPSLLKRGSFEAIVVLAYFSSPEAALEKGKLPDSVQNCVIELRFVSACRQRMVSYQRALTPRRATGDYCIKRWSSGYAYIIPICVSVTWSKRVCLSDQ